MMRRAGLERKLTNVQDFVADKKTCGVLVLLKVVHYCTVGIRFGPIPHGILALCPCKPFQLPVESFSLT